MRVGASLSLRENPVHAVSEAAGRAIVQSRAGGADAALCWVTPPHARSLDRVCRQLGEGLGIARFAGAVVSGLSVGGREVHERPAVAVMTFQDPQPWRFSTLLFPDLTRHPGQAGAAITAGLERGDLVVAMVSASGFNPPPFVTGLLGSAPRARLVGGGAVNADGADWVFTEEGIHGDAFATLGIAGCAPETAVAHSCRPLTGPLKVTASRGRLLSALEGSPPLKFIKKLIRAGHISEDDLGRRVMLGSAMHSDMKRALRGGYAVRPLLGVERKLGTFYTGGELEQGSWVLLVKRERRWACQELNAAALELQRSVGLRGRPSFGVSVNCSGRGPGFQGLPEHDAPILRAQLPGFPLAGFSGAFELYLQPVTSPVQLFCHVLALGW